MAGDRTPRVGVIGLGRMGLALACRLRALGVPVSGFNRSTHRARRLVAAGGRLLASPAEVASASDIVLTAVTGPADVENVLLGPAGVQDSGREGLTVVDLSTIDASTSCRIATELKQHGIEMLDAPMTGSVQAAEAGTLGLLVGGESEVLQRVRPTLQLIAEHIHHFGGHGAGCSAKLALNLLVGAMSQSLAEAFSFLSAAGLSRKLFLEAVGASGLSSPLFERVGQRALAQDFEPRFALHDLHKDLALLVEESEQMGLDLRLAQAVEKLVEAAAREGGELDYSSLVSAEERRPRGVVEPLLTIP